MAEFDREGFGRGLMGFGINMLKSSGGDYTTAQQLGHALEGFFDARQKLREQKEKEAKKESEKTRRDMLAKAFPEEQQQYSQYLDTPSLQDIVTKRLTAQQGLSPEQRAGLFSKFTPESITEYEATGGKSPLTPIGKEEGMNLSQKAGLYDKFTPESIAGYMSSNGQVPLVPLQPDAQGDRFGAIITTMDQYGNPRIRQLSKTGEPVEIQIPPGEQLVETLRPIDNGTYIDLTGTRSGKVYSTTKKEVPVGTQAIIAAQSERQEAGPRIAAATETAKTKAEKQIAAPAAIEGLNDKLALIDTMLAHPGLEIATGISGNVDPRALLPGQPGYEFKTLNDQLQSSAFVNEVDKMRGLGHMDRNEGTQIRQALTNIQTGLSGPAYVAELRRIRGIFERAKTRNLGYLSNATEGEHEIGGVKFTVRKK